jgi:hypothetical protein
LPKPSEPPRRSQRDPHGEKVNKIIEVLAMTSSQQHWKKARQALAIQQLSS